MKKKIVWVAFAATAVVAVLVGLMMRRDGGIRPDAESGAKVAVDVRSGGDAVADGIKRASVAREDLEGASHEGGNGRSEEEESLSEEERAEAAEEAKVEAFDNLTDKWMETAKAGVTMKDVDAFSKAFREVPKNRQDECVHRALNLIPDENVMLLAGILMDKSMDREIVETVFNDILNRDEDVKKPIMKEIFKDKTHPCWADTAWIFDVTGESEKK